MRNILNLDTTKNPIDLGYANESCSLNSIYLYIKVPNITNPSIEVTLNDGTTTSLDITSYGNGQVNSEIPLNTYKNAGSIKIRVLADDYTSEYITFSTPYDLLATDNIVVKINDSGEYYIKNLSSGGSVYKNDSGGTGNLTLEKNVYGAEYLEIFYGRTSHSYPSGSVKVAKNSNGEFECIMTLTYGYGNGSLAIVSAWCVISGNSLVYDEARSVVKDIVNSTISTQAENQIAIYEIISYE